MRWLLTLGVAAALLVLPTGADECGAAIAWGGTCEVSNPGDSVVVEGGDTTPGNDGSSGGGGGSTDPEGESGSDDENCSSELCRPNYNVGGLPDVTISDLAIFTPARPSLTGEPTGVAVVGMPANVISTASEQHIPGTLFEYDVVVRFTPAAFRFDYGDGGTRTSATGGTTWARLGQAEFTPTATSHVYRSRGTFAASVTVQYSAAVDFGTGWRAVPGYVEATTSGYGVRVVAVHTALVDRTCLENPGGPGC